MMIEQILASLGEYWLTLVAILLLICASAFFSGSETALTATSRARMHSLEVNGDLRAGVVNFLIERRDRLIGALLIGNNLVNILASSLTTSLFLGLFGDFSFLQNHDGYTQPKKLKQQSYTVERSHRCIQQLKVPIEKRQQTNGNSSYPKNKRTLQEQILILI